MKISPEQLKLYAVTDRSWLKPDETLASVTEELLRAGVSCVQLREKNASDEEILQEAALLKEICERYNVPLIINDRPDLAQKANASGVHVGLSDMGIQKARQLLGPDFIIGGSAHNVKEALAAQNAGADYIGCGAVFGSTTKTNVTQLPVETLRAICQAVEIPAVLLLTTFIFLQEVGFPVPLLSADFLNLITKPKPSDIFLRNCKNCKSQQNNKE